ncbi:transferase [Aureococcus anophagefferens]|nr:transferase [Aureococcus anophagefferens]
MKRILAMLALLAARCDARGQVIAWEDERAEVLLAASDLPVPPSATLPKTFSWRRIAGYGSMLVASMNQHVPKYCGACFAFASFHALADRVKIARYLALRSGGDAFDGPDLVAAIQVMLNCGGDDEGWGVAGSCATGGSSAGVYRWVERFGGVPAAGCFPYLATDGLGCAPDTICRNCMPSNEDGSETECWAVPGCCPAPSTWAPRRRPRPCAPRSRAANVDATTYLRYRAGLVPASPVGDRRANDTDHVIEVVGWGESDELGAYWEIRNSWGEYWGDNGFAKVRRGLNDGLIEAHCTWVHPGGWGVPNSPTWQDNADVQSRDAGAASLVAVHGGPWRLADGARGLGRVAAAAVPVFGVALLVAAAARTKAPREVPRAASSA